MKTNFYNCKADENTNLKSYTGRVLRIILILLFLVDVGFSAFSQTTSLTFSQTSYANTDLIAPGRGAEHWNGATWDNTYNPMVPAGNSDGLNVYYRFNWSDIEGPTQGSYDWTIFDRQINGAIAGGKSFSFGIMPICTACGTSGAYPAYLHTLMQSEATNSKDWLNGNGDWIPNWNSPNYLARYQALLTAVANHIATGSFNGKNYRDVIFYIDIRGYGDFGEWHTAGWTGTEPTGRLATTASLIALIDMNLNTFPNYPQMICMGAYDGQHDSKIPAQVSYYAMTAKNVWGEIGLRRDNWGDAGYMDWIVNNPGSYNPGTGVVSFATLGQNKWKYGIVGGEPANDAAAISRNCGTPHCDLENEVRTLHASSFGNGNYPVSATDPNLRANVIAASKASGYRLVLGGGSMTTTLTPGLSFNVTLNWQNVGVAPVYQNWNTTYELRSSGGSVVWTGLSSFTPKLFLPQASATPVSDVFTLPAGVAAGTYSLYLIMKDPTGYKSPLPLAITGRNTDGSYLIRNNITVGAGSGNQPPTANAGTDQTIQLPANTTTLSGTGTDPDGTIASYAWTKVSGPAGGNIATPSTASTNITGLVQGVYVFKLTVTDNLGATGSANVQVTVNAASTPPAFIISAGPDQNLAAGTTTTTLTGTLPPSGSAPASDTVNLIIIQGESNAGGLADNAPALASELASRSSVRILNNSTLKFENLHIGVNNEINQFSPDPPNEHGLELGLANEVEAGRLPNPAYLVKIGVSGSYVAQWLPGSTRGLWEIYTPYVDTAIAILNAMGKKYRIVVWQSLGLNDKYGQGTTDVNFMAMMAQFRAAFRLKYGANIRFLSTDFNNPPAQTFDWDYVWGLMAAADPLFFSIPVTGATYIDGSTHWDYAGMKLIAHNMVNTMLSSVPGAAGGGTGTSGSTYTSVWSKVSGPAGGTIVSPNAATTNITGLVAGTYVYRLSVTNNAGTTVTSDVKITVQPGNQPPIANAGGNITITLPTNTTTLNGSASSDPNGTIIAYSWTKLSGPTQFNISNPNAVTTVLSNLVQGVYTFRLQVLDNSGATASDTIKVTVNPAPPVNQPPVANAGANSVITLPVNSTTLNGTASYDPDGSITTYAWSEISGPAQYSIANAAAASTALTNLVAGTYVFRLTVTDNLGATGSATVTVTVNPAPPPGNQPPVANAGPNITITLPTNVALLNGSGSNDPDGTIVLYSWSQISGPAQSTIANPASANTGISNLVQGVYIFRLQVTDNGGATASATVTVTVNPAPPPGNIPPIANAGTDITITLPINTTKLDGTRSSDPDGIIVAYSWNKISGPGAITIVNSNTATPTVTGLQAGQYVFELTVTDNGGATGKARVNVLVNNAANQSPVANAGKDTTIALPVSSCMLDGSKSKDPDGIIVKYSWKQVSGPSSASISKPSSVTTQVLGLITEGDYVFQLDVTDNAGAVSIATVKVTVVNNFRFTQSFKIYPNPVVVTLNIEYIDDNNGKIKILVFDAAGRQVINDEYTKSGSIFTKQINVDRLKSGTYFMQLVHTDGTTLIRPFVKQ